MDLQHIKKLLPKHSESIWTILYMKIFLDDFIMYSDMESCLQKFKLCFLKVWRIWH